ncbi:hypothetical protein LTR09_004423 [Extremus antarcticus]|uniref:Uncharacterized protein n=1 Tax=Extremus antarcticus TaxID=702011 RepID=A0AAJ0DIF8_9PEZI|nr:hypothetical protein LTR09_004423 [Extremus antarcticus]
MKRTVASALGFGDRTRYCEVAPGVTMREENSRFEVVSALVLETDRSSIVEKMFTPPVKRKVKAKEEGDEADEKTGAQTKGRRLTRGSRLPRVEEEDDEDE